MPLAFNQAFCSFVTVSLAMTETPKDLNFSQFLLKSAHVCIHAKHQDVSLNSWNSKAVVGFFAHLCGWVCDLVYATLWISVNTWKYFQMHLCFCWHLLRLI